MSEIDKVAYVWNSWTVIANIAYLLRYHTHRPPNGYSKRVQASPARFVCTHVFIDGWHAGPGWAALGWGLVFGVVG